MKFATNCNVFAIQDLFCLQLGFYKLCIPSLSNSKTNTDNISKLQPKTICFKFYFVFIINQMLIVNLAICKLKDKNIK